MASNRPAVRRGTTSTVPSAHPKPVINLEEWESKAPLGDIETKSVNTIKAASERIPLPLKFSQDDPGSSRPSTPTILRNGIKLRASSNSRPSTPLLGSSRPQPTHALLPKQPVQTPQQFYDWFALVDRSVAHSQEAHFRAHLESLSEHLETCDRLVQRVDEIDRDVDDMLIEWRSVEEGGKNLKDACERLLDERDKLLEVTDAIGERLEYFQELEHATRMLNHPGESLVLQTDFLYMVERVDICIDYLRAHRHFREAEVYLLRFQQCLTRAMTLIRMYFMGSLKALTADITKRISEKDVSSTAQAHLLYTRFKSVAPQLAPLLGELERRAKAHPEELSALLSECHAAYFSARKGLLVPRLMEEIKGLDPTRTELVELTRSGCSYLKQLCIDEFNLYRSFFNSGEDQLYSYLENLCDYLYDDLRPRILHEPRLTVLCEVCTVLQALMVLDLPSLPDSETQSQTGEEEEYDGELTIDFSFADEEGAPKRRGLGRLHISHLLQMVLQDAQTRLFFKAQSVIQAEIRYYVPKPEDLAYPDKLVGARKPATGTEIREKESISQLFFQISSLEMRDTWYPTLQKTMWVLSQLHNFVQPAIFEDIAQEAVGLCRQSLVAASETIKSKNTSTSALDAHLFLVRHLLILKEMARNLELVHPEPGGSSFAGMTDTLASVVNRTTSLFTSLGLPQGDQGMMDARQGIDQDLKLSCEEIITMCSEPICEPLRTWVFRIRTYNINARTGSPPLAPPEPAADELDRNFRLACHRDLRAGVARMRLYLEDDKTVGVLVGHAVEKIVEEYGEFREVVSNVYAEALRKEVMSEEGLKEMLREICGEKALS